MSHYRKSHFESPAQVRQHLEKINLSGEMGPEDIQLLTEYRSIDYGTNAVLDRAAAIEAFENVSQSYPEAKLTELGIEFPPLSKKVYDPGYNSAWTSDEKDYLKRMVAANKEFLEEWDEIRRGKRAKDKALTELIKEADALINRSEQNEKVQLNGTLSTVLEAVQEQGYTVEEKDIEKLQGQQLSDFVRNGSAFKAKNPAGDMVDVRLTGNQIYVHVEDAQNNLLACEDKSKKLMRAVELLVRKNHGDNPLGGLYAVTDESGFGRGEEAPAKQGLQSPEAAPYQNPPQERKLGL